MTKNFTPIDDLIKKYKSQPSVSIAKEVEPAPLAKETIEIKEVVEHKAEEEVRPYVSPRHETIELPPDLKKMGLREVTTTQFPTYQNVRLPLADEKIVVGLHAPITASLRWLATLAVYILKMSHLTLKTVHGRVIRVFRP